MLKLYIGITQVFIAGDDELTPSPNFLQSKKDILYFRSPKKRELHSLIKLVDDNPNSFKTIVVHHPYSYKLESRLFSRFNIIRAGGGMVINENDEALLIFRNGKWDLPKGKMDPGESIKDTAIREVEEETGIKGLQLDELISLNDTEQTFTLHTYVDKEDNKILKPVFWYLMKAPKQHLVPQKEEGISACRWVHIDELDAYFEQTFKSIKDVIKSGVEQWKRKSALS